MAQIWQTGADLPSAIIPWGMWARWKCQVWAWWWISGICYLGRSRNYETALQTHLFYSRDSNTEPGNMNHLISGKEKLKCSWAVVFASLYSCGKMAEATFSQDKLCVQFVWISWRIRWPFPVDTVTVRAVYRLLGSRGSGESLQLPQCRHTFRPRPALARNTMMAEMVEELKKRKRPADCDAGAGDVQCDVCTGRKYKAVKSCLVCLESYCQNHLEQHESWFKGKTQSDWSHWTTAGDDLPETWEASRNVLYYWQAMHLCAVYGIWT